MKDTSCELLCHVTRVQEWGTRLPRRMQHSVQIRPKKQTAGWWGVRAGIQSLASAVVSTTVGFHTHSDTMAQQWGLPFQREKKDIVKLNKSKLEQNRICHSSGQAEVNCCGFKGANSFWRSETSGWVSPRGRTLHPRQCYLRTFLNTI